MARRKPQQMYQSDRAWHLDKRVPIALIITLMVQAGSIIWWARGVSENIDKIRTDIQLLQTDAKERSARMEQVVVIQTEIKQLNETVGRLERTLERLFPVLPLATPRR